MQEVEVEVPHVEQQDLEEQVVVELVEDQVTLLEHQEQLTQVVVEVEHQHNLEQVQVQQEIELVEQAVRESLS
jgi:hypothetical protein